MQRGETNGALDFFSAFLQVHFLLVCVVIERRQHEARHDLFGPVELLHVDEGILQG